MKTVAWSVALIATSMAACALAGEPAIGDTCPGESSFGQPPLSAQDVPGFSGDGDGLRAYDDFTDVAGPITGITWWGGGAAGGECVHTGDFEIGFYTNAGGQPGDLLTMRGVSPSYTATGTIGPLGTIYRYEATFSTPVNLASAWVSVFAVDFDACYFYWASGAAGNNNAYTSGGGNTAGDFAYCLVTEGNFAESDCSDGADISQPLSGTLSTPGFSDAGDGLRAYENFSGVNNPIARVVWWGGGSAGGVNCDRNTDFEIAFYEDNGGQPGSLVASETVMAFAQPTGTFSALGNLYRYEAALAAPVMLAAGWVSVFGTDFSNCYFYWANSDTGDGFAYGTNGSIGDDFAYCLYTQDGIHTGDQNGDLIISLSELLRVIQFFNSAGLGCEANTEDGYAPNDPDQGCAPHESDYNPQDWVVSLSELLRLIQFYNSGGYAYCPDADPATEDGFCPGGA